jgi:hypothetical protein
MQRQSCCIGFAWLACASAGVIPVAGCGPAAPTGKPPPAVAAEPDAPTGAAIADPALREARDRADAILAGLLTGKFDDDPALEIASRKMKGLELIGTNGLRSSCTSWEGTNAPAGCGEEDAGADAAGWRAIPVSGCVQTPNYLAESQLARGIAEERS